MNNRLIIMSGIPGSGKTTYAAKYKEIYEEQGYVVMSVSSDDIRMEMFGKYDSFENERAVWKTVNDRVAQYSGFDNTIVILDATTVTNQARYQYAKRYKDMYKEIDLVVVNTPFEQCLKQNVQRPANKIVPVQVLQRMASKLEAIDTMQWVDYFTSARYYIPGDEIPFEEIKQLKGELL